MKKLLISIGLLLAFCPSFAQTELLRPIENLEFANFGDNKLLYPGDSLAMERFFAKMDSVLFLGQGNVSIMHIGGSHVQAGVFTQQFRNDLLGIGTDLIGGQNFVFPFAAGGCGTRATAARMREMFMRALYHVCGRLGTGCNKPLRSGGI